MLLLVVGNFSLFFSSFNRELSFFDMARPTPQDTMISTRRFLRANTTIDLFGEDESPAFSTCLLVRDVDNSKLVEWIAYHYFAMPLRYVVVLRDPASQVASDEVLRRWKPLLNIVPWTDENLVDKDAKTSFARSESENESENENEQEFQVRREKAFYHSCALHMQTNKRAMVSFQQVNEYAAINEDFVINAKSLIQQPGSVLRLLQAAHSYEAKKTPLSCVTTYSTQFSAITSSNAEDVKAGVPDFLDAQRFDTLKWRYRRLTKIDQIGKSFLDMSSIPDLQTLTASKVRGLYEFSPACLPSRYRPDANIRIHVYPPPGDYGVVPVETSEGNARDVVNDEARPWIQAFVDLVGKETAEMLLYDAGGS